MPPTDATPRVVPVPDSPFGPITWHAEIGSTNTALAELARAGDAGVGAMMAADHQSAGRGRLDRTWVAPAGSGVMMSILMAGGDHPALAATAVGLAARAAVADLAGVDARLKWPNDLVVGDRKLAGVLAEAVVGADGLMVVVGIGLNVDWGGDVPSEISEIAVDLAGLVDGPVPSTEHVAVGIASRLGPLADRAQSDPAGLVADAAAASATVGRDVVVTPVTGDDIVGRAAGLTPAGELVVATADGDVVVSVGDVRHVRPS